MKCHEWLSHMEFVIDLNKRQHFGDALIYILGSKCLRATYNEIKLFLKPEKLNRLTAKSTSR